MSRLVSFLKKMYLYCASPLLRMVDSRIAAVEIEKASNQVTAVDIKRLLADVENLRSLVDRQANYLNSLRDSGLSDMVADYSTKNLRPPMIVLAAVNDLLAGIEPSTVALTHQLPTDEIILWAKLFAARQCLNVPVQDGSMETIMQGERTFPDERSCIKLLENQLQFNLKNSLDRELAANLESKRLMKLLQLERGASGNHDNAK